MPLCRREPGARGLGGEGGKLEVARQEGVSLTRKVSPELRCKEPWASEQEGCRAQRKGITGEQENEAKEPSSAHSIRDAALDFNADIVNFGCCRAIQNHFLQWRKSSLSELSNMVATSYVWLKCEHLKCG